MPPPARRLRPCCFECPPCLVCFVVSSGVRFHGVLLRCISSAVCALRAGRSAPCARCSGTVPAAPRAARCASGSSSCCTAHWANPHDCHCFPQSPSPLLVSSLIRSFLEPSAPPRPAAEPAKAHAHAPMTPHAPRRALLAARDHAAQTTASQAPPSPLRRSFTTVNYKARARPCFHQAGRRRILPFWPAHHQPDHHLRARHEDEQPHPAHGHHARWHAHVRLPRRRMRGLRHAHRRQL